MLLAYIIFAFTQHAQYGSDGDGNGLHISDNVTLLSLSFPRFKTCIFFRWIIDMSKIVWAAASYINDTVISVSGYVRRLCQIRDR